MTGRLTLTRRLITPFLAVFALVAAGAGPAHADESDALWIAVPYEMTLLGTDADGNAPTRTLTIELSHDNTNMVVPAGTLTVDVTELADLAEITWPANCTERIGGTGQDRTVTGDCSFPELSTDSYVHGAEIGITATSAAVEGTVATIRSTAVAGDLTAYPAETTVTVLNGPDLGLVQAPNRTGVRPGTPVDVPITLTNNGNRTADRTLLTLFASHGVDFASRHENCEYTHEGAPATPVGTWALCVLDEPVAPGRTSSLDAGALRAKRSVLYDRFDYGVEPYSDEALEQARAGRPFVRGHGAELDLRAAGAASRVAADDDVDTSDNNRSVLIKAVNTADLKLIGGKVAGAAGETVTASVTVKNRGPAWVASLGAGEPVATVDFTVPRGTAVTAKPEECYALDASGEWREEQLGAPRYRCTTPNVLHERASHTFPFSLRVDRVVPGARGKAVTLNDRPDLRIRDFDPNLANNRAAVVVNG
ncbi:hypothetical protein [Streptomyces lushanensis]|uniref:hypothetical protein n=1 Tax=Streptomyces lushanensis TaxID=1434255 RepID=UPI00082E46BE|nr:hypothetical protein [Streptomyces lushanensis]